MWHTRVHYLRSAILCLLIVAIPDFICGLRNVTVTIPTAVKRGDSAILVCNYDIENDTLYTVKWYKGRREFYRYTPKENPAMKIFPAPGINVEKAQSNQSQVMLTAVPLTISGKFSCEVSADAPSFHTLIVLGEMEVVELPNQRPIITGIHSRYRLGDVINGNCSSDYSKPAANLAWWINDIAVLPNYIRTYEIQKHTEENLESAVLEINFIVTYQHFIKGRLKLKCSARIHDIYEQESEKMIEEDRPRILASGRSPDANLYPFDQPADGDFGDQSELFLTHYKNSPTSAADSIAKIRKRRSCLVMDSLFCCSALSLLCLILPLQLPSTATLRHTAIALIKDLSPTTTASSKRAPHNISGVDYTQNSCSRQMALQLQYPALVNGNVHQIVASHR